MSISGTRPGLATSAGSGESSRTSSHSSRAPSPKTSHIPEGHMMPQKKRRQITVACNQCRKRKSKCDGIRPSCAACHSRDSECHYEADPDASPIVALKRKYEILQKQSEENETLLRMLRTRSESEAIAILRRIRTCETASSPQFFPNDTDAFF